MKNPIRTVTNLGRDATYRAGFAIGYGAAAVVGLALSRNRRFKEWYTGMEEMVTVSQNYFGAEKSDQ